MAQKQPWYFYRHMGRVSWSLLLKRDGIPGDILSGKTPVNATMICLNFLVSISRRDQMLHKLFTNVSTGWPVNGIIKIPVYSSIFTSIFFRNPSMLKTWQLKILMLPLIREHHSGKQNIIVQKGMPTFKTHFYLEVIVSKAF